MSSLTQHSSATEVLKILLCIIMYLSRPSPSTDVHAADYLHNTESVERKRRDARTITDNMHQRKRRTTHTSKSEGYQLRVVAALCRENHAMHLTALIQTIHHLQDLFYALMYMLPSMITHPTYDSITWCNLPFAPHAAADTSGLATL
jgi:hypothetical protein